MSVKRKDDRMDSLIHIDKDFILVDYPAGKKSDVINALGNRMYEKGMVKEDFVSAVLKREENYPTALNLGEVNIAIPHTEPEYVNSPCLGVAILKDPVLFHQMDDADAEIPVKIVFLIALNSGHAHVELLKNIMLTCGDRTFLDQLLALGDVTEIEEKISKNLLI